MAENLRMQLIIDAANKTGQVWQSLKGQFKSALKDADNFKLRMTELDGFLKAGIGVGALYGLQHELTDSLDVAEQLENSLRGLASTARYTGQDIGASMQAATDLAEDGLIDVASSAQALQNLLSRGFSLEEAIQMIERLKDAAAFNRQASLSMSDAVRSATEGLKNENSILVDNAGVTKNVSVMWKEYAAQLGKGVNELTQAEKRQAEFNGILRETEGQVGNAQLAMNGITGAKAQLSVEVTKLKNALGTGLVPAFLAVGKAANWVLQEVIKPFMGGIEITGARLGAWATKVGALSDWIGNGFEGGTDALEAEFDRLNTVFDEQAAAIVAKWDGAIEIPQLGADTGKRRQDVDTGGSAEKKSTKGGKEKEYLDSWRRMHRDRFEVKSRALEAEIQLEQEAADLERVEWEATKDSWHQMHDDRFEVRSRALDQMLEKDKEAFAQMDQFGIQAARNIQSAFADFLFDPLEEGFDGMLQSFGDTLQRMAAEVASQQILSGLFSGLAKSDNGFLSSIGSAFVGADKYHSGGLVVPRFHAGGLLADEVPAILQTGERVLSRKDNRLLESLAANAGGVSVQVINNGAGQARVEQGGRGADGRQLIRVIVGEVAKDIRQGGPSGQAIASTFGVNRLGVTR